MSFLQIPSRVFWSRSNVLVMKKKKNAWMNLKIVTYSKKVGENDGSSGMSRTQRRIMERKQRRKEKQEERRRNTDLKQGVVKTSMSGESSSVNINNETMKNISKRLRQIMIGAIPGANMTRQHFRALAFRFPFFLLLCYVFTDEDTSPYVVQASLGPSMLPTIQFAGDIWLVETGAWSRLLGRPLSIEKGDLVLWKNPSSGRVSCKRVIGKEGDYVQRYGEYAYLYGDRSNFAIVWPDDMADRVVDMHASWVADKNNTKGKKNPYSVYNIPKDHVWLEGDCPPFSFDSRHYGPIPLSWICGRLRLRLWPWKREDEEGVSYSSWVERTRPEPFPSIDDYLGSRFNFYRVPKADSSTIDEAIRPSSETENE